MLLHHFYQKENKDRNKVNAIYLKIINLSIKFSKKKEFLIKKDFKTSFEIFSLFLILYIKNIKDFNINNYKIINQELINLFVDDLDISFREMGIGDMKIGKYVKSYVRKFYFRLSNMDNIFNNMDNDKYCQFLSKLNFIKKNKISLASQLIFKNYLEIQSSLKKNQI